MTETRPRAHPRQADPDAALLDDDDYEPVPRMPMCEESTHLLLLRRRKAAAERDARLRALRRAWGSE